MSEQNVPSGGPGLPAAQTPLVQNAAIRTAAGSAGGAGYNIGLKLLFVGVMIVAFVIPVFLIWGLNTERSERSWQAATEVSKSWAGFLEVGTPFVLVPYRLQLFDAKNKPYIVREFITVMPQSQNVTGTIDPSIRYKGIFPVPLFSAKLKSSLSFNRPSISVFGPSLYKVDWEQAAVVYPVRSFASLAAPIEGRWNDTALVFDNPTPDMTIKGSVLAAQLNLSGWEKSAALDLNLSLRGSSYISLKPVAKANTLVLDSTWASPSFFGSTLPESREISEKGFSARWSVISFASPETVEVPKENGMADLSGFIMDHYDDEGAWGVNFFQPMSVYQLMDRALKYSILFIIVPFVALFLFETMLRLRIHLVQYLLVGLADLLFFLLLLPLSEQVAFEFAYLAAACAVVLLVSWYVGQILKSTRRGLIMGGMLTLLYGYMFAALRSEDYALIIGAVGLFLIVAAVMIFTRKIDWYALSQRSSKTDA